MKDVIKIIIALLAALLMFLIGWFGGSWKTRRRTKDECGDIIKTLQDEHKNALEAQKSEYEKKLEEKNKIVKRLEKIIERLLNILSSDDGTGKIIAESIAGGRLKRTLLVQAENLKKL